MKNEKVYKLTIESGIGGGSVSIIGNGEVLDFRQSWYLNRTTDYLIESISDLLESTNIEKSKIDSIIYSVYPGSHTGLKIGAAIALGLQLALNSKIERKDLFESIFENLAKPVKAQQLIVLPLNATDFVWKLYNADGMVEDFGQARFMNEKDENIYLGTSEDFVIYIPFYLFENPSRICDKFTPGKCLETVDLGDNLSGYLAVG